MIEEMDDRSFLWHCNTLLENRSFQATELARLCRMAGLDDIAALWGMVEQFHPEYQIACDNEHKVALVVDAMTRAKDRLPLLN